MDVLQALQQRGCVAGSEDRTVKIWDTRTRGSQREFESRAPVTCVTLVQGQNELISGDQDGNIRVWDITGGQCSCELVPEVDVAVRSVSVAMDGSQVRCQSAAFASCDLSAPDRLTSCLRSSEVSCSPAATRVAHLTCLRNTQAVIVAGRCHSGDIRIRELQAWASARVLYLLVA
jgi:WD40 repeat protein